MNETIAKQAENSVGKNREQVGCKGTYAWCAHYVGLILDASGIKTIKGFETRNMYSCTEMQRLMKQDCLNWDEPDDYPERGDIIFFDWDRVNEEKPLDHVGIVKDFDRLSGTITYINGNGSNADYVTSQEIHWQNNSIAYWMRYTGVTSDRVQELERQLAELKNKIGKIKNILDN